MRLLHKSTLRNGGVKGMRRHGRTVAIVLGLIFVVAVVVIGILAFTNSPQQVAQKWADALTRRDAKAMEKLVLPKDREKTASLLGVANMLPDMSVQLVGIEEQQGQKVAKFSVKFTRVAFGKMNFSLNGNMNLTFVLARHLILFWRIDLEKSESLIREEAMKAVKEAIRQNPTIQQLLQFLPLR